MDSRPTLKILNLGLQDFQETWQLQKKLQRDLIDKTGLAHLLLVTHPPVITLGTSTKEKNLLVDKETLAAKDIQVVKIERGGDITYHDPAQLIAYPIIDLHNHKTDVGWYMRALEQVVIDTLLEFGITGIRQDGKTGVWIDSNNKICSIGVRLSRWCSMHGLALNVKDSTQGFSYINPCGFNDIYMTSLERLGISASLEKIQSVLVSNFIKLFDYPKYDYGIKHADKQ